MQRFVVQSDSREAIGIEPASGTLINGDCRVERRCSRLSFEGPRFVRGDVQPELVHFAWLAEDAAYHGRAVQVCGGAFVLNLLPRIWKGNSFVIPSSVTTLEMAGPCGADSETAISASRTPSGDGACKACPVTPCPETRMDRVWSSLVPRITTRVVEPAVATNGATELILGSLLPPAVSAAAHSIAIWPDTIRNRFSIARSRRDVHCSGQPSVSSSLLHCRSVLHRVSLAVQPLNGPAPKRTSRLTCSR